MLRVHQLMTKKIASATKDTSVVEAAKMMREHGCGSIVVVDGNHPIGIFTETDLLKRVVAEGLSPSETRIEHVMTKEAIVAMSSHTLSETSRRMSLAKIRRMPVVDNENKLVGVISKTDIRRYMKDLEKDLLDIT